MLLMSATNTKDTLYDVMNIFKIPMKPNYFNWYASQNFLRTELCVEYFNSANLSTHMKSRFYHFIKENPELNSQFLIFVNSPSHTITMRHKVCNMLYGLDIKKHVIILNGNCFPEEKYYAMAKFCNNDSHKSVAGCVFTGGVGSVGIDNPNVYHVIYVNIPESVSDLYQGMCRAGRQYMSLPYKDIVDIGVDLEGFLFLMQRNTFNLKNLKCISECEKYRCMKEMTDNVIECLKLLSLGTGCFHTRMANAMGNPASRIWKNIPPS